MNNNINKNKSNMMDLTISVIKSIKNAVVENKIEISSNNFVMWDVCKKEYKFFINENVPFYYKMPDGVECGNFNPSFNIKDMMEKDDLSCYKEWLSFIDRYVEEVSNMIGYYNGCKF